MKLPDAFGRDLPGPQFGMEGSRRLTGVTGRPIIGTIVKPALGLRPPETAEIVGELIGSGVDFIKDDEKLMSPAYSPLAERVAAIMPKILDHEQKTGKKVMYAFGISHADPDQMMRNHDIVAQAGGNCAVVNINSIGMGGHDLSAQTLQPRPARASQWLGHPHPPPRPRHGFSGVAAVLATDRRRPVPDQRHRREYWEPDDSFVASFEAVTTPLFSPADCCLPVAGSGQWGGQAPETYRRTGRTVDLLYLCGGGIVSHPQGPAAGVRAVSQAWEAAVAGIPLADFARSHEELAASLAKFGAGHGD